MKKIKRGILTLIISPILLVMLYFLFAGILTLIPTRFTTPTVSEEVTVYVRSNGVHTDLIVPIKNETYNWLEFLDTTLYLDREARYLSIGWGDKGFYLNTPEWKDLKFSTAFNAAFWLSSSAMHVSTSSSPRLSETCKSIKVSKEQYLKLVEYIQIRFKKNENGSLLPIHGHHYSGEDDYFYDANGTYSFLFTCNSWANGGLKAMDVKTAIWAPFDWCIFYWR